jgi:predicted RNA binding protein YcfA (HicA-like mRNA interferase family)
MKLPRDLSGLDAIRVLERFGFRVVRQTGSHVRLVKHGQSVTLPLHSAIAPGTLRSVIRQAGVSLEEFVRELR